MKNIKIIFLFLASLGLMQNAFASTKNKQREILLEFKRSNEVVRMVIGQDESVSFDVCQNRVQGLDCSEAETIGEGTYTKQYFTERMEDLRRYQRNKNIGRATGAAVGVVAGALGGYFLSGFGPGPLPSLKDSVKLAALVGAVGGGIGLGAMEVVLLIVTEDYKDAMEVLAQTEGYIEHPDPSKESFIVDQDAEDFIADLSLVLMD